MNKANDRIYLVAAVTIALFVFVVIAARSVADGPVREDAPVGHVVAKVGGPKTPGQLEKEQAEAAWERDNGASNLVTAPPESFGLANVPGGRRVWHKKAGGIESWGYVTEASATDVGVSFLTHYRDAGGWKLGYSEVLDMSGGAWGGIVSNTSLAEVVVCIALPKRLGERPGGTGNPTRVSVMRVAGVEDLLEVVGDLPSMDATGVPDAQ